MDTYFPHIELPEGITIGHAGNSVTGCTAILCEGAVAGVDVRGGAPGTRETDLLHNEKAMNRIDAVVLTGGSAYGLEACCGVMAYLRDHGKGFAIGEKVVPIVCGAVLYDLNGPDYNYPDFQMGRLAAESASAEKIPFGKIGAGTGATVGKIRGLDYACEGGIGAYCVRSGEAFVTAVVAVNALGDVVDPNTNQIVAGARANDGTFLDTAGCILSGNFPRLLYGNTTIGCIITNAALTKVQANNLACVAQNGLARAIRPVHTEHDGDTLFCVAKGNAKVDQSMLGVMATEAVTRAILGAVQRK